jgi:hypothetical protein
MAADRVMPPVAGERRKDMEGLCLIGKLGCCVNKQWLSVRTGREENVPPDSSYGKASQFIAVCEIYY